jgi:hypothetical protein
MRYSAGKRLRGKSLDAGSSGEISGDGKWGVGGKLPKFVASFGLFSGALPEWTDA